MTNSRSPIYTTSLKMLISADPQKVSEAEVEFYKYDPTWNLTYVNVRSIPFIEDSSDQVCLIVDDKNRYSLPGGRIEPGETPDEAMIRETLEESNTEVVSMTPFAVMRYIWKDDGASEYVLFYKTTVKLLEGNINDPDKESIERKVIPFEDLRGYFQNSIIFKYVFDIFMSEKTPDGKN